jgi:hypothetical protein
MLKPDRAALCVFLNELFRYADSLAFISLRAFRDDVKDKPPLFTEAVRIDDPALVDRIEARAREAANSSHGHVFAPPVATFKTANGAKVEDLAEGVALSVECDRAPSAARGKLIDVLGKPTVTVASGGEWFNPTTKITEPKLHLHWRLTSPARSAAEHGRLREARELAAALTGADRSNISIVHPLRWPGSFHRKNPDKPRIAYILDSVDTEIELGSALGKLRAACPQPQPQSQPTPATSPAQPVALADIIAALAAIPGTDDRAEWIRVGEAVFAASAGADAGFEAWDAWSRKAPTKYGGTEKAWGSFARSPPRRIGFGTLHYLATLADPWWRPPGQKIPPDPSPRPANGGDASAAPPLHAYVPRAFADIPPRRWLHAGHYIRGQVVMTVAPGGYGKTSLVLCNAIEMSVGVGLIGALPSESTLRVAYWNAEDPDEEVERRIAAVCIRHQLSPSTLAGRLFLGSRITGGHRIATLDRAGNVVFDQKLLDVVTAFIGDNAIDCAIFDPLVAFHRVPESDNVAMEETIEAFGRIAEATGCCVELSQHTRKSQGTPGELTADDSRGASAIVYAARSVRVLNRMTASEAELPRIEPEERRHYLRVHRDKTNLAPPGKATWVHLISIDLPNGDKVQAAEPWVYPEPCEGVTADDARWAREEVARKAYRTTPKSPDWFGYALGDHLKLGVGVHGAPRTPGERGNRRRVTAILQAWLDRGVLGRDRRRDGDSRKEFEFFRSGDTEGEE